MTLDTTTLRPIQNDRHFRRHVEIILLYEKYSNYIQIAPKLVPKGPVDKIPDSV